MFNSSSTARPCDKFGNFLNDGEPPPPPEPQDPTDWTPFESRTHFETAAFLFQKEKMSADNIDHLMTLWEASAASTGGESPFVNYTHLYDTIDRIPVGGVQWQSLSVSYNGPQPETDAPPWMEQTYDVYFRDPRDLFLNMLANPEFAEDFDFTPKRVFDSSGTRQYEHFMSGDWAWKQAVGFFYICGDCFIHSGILRTLSRPRFQNRMAQCLFHSSWEVIRPQFRLELVRSNIGQFMGQLGIFIIMSVVHTGVDWFL